MTKKTIERSNRFQILKWEFGNWSVCKWWLWISKYTLHRACMMLQISQQKLALHAQHWWDSTTTFLSKKNQKSRCLCLYLHMIMDCACTWPVYWPVIWMLSCYILPYAMQNALYSLQHLYFFPFQFSFTLFLFSECSGSSPIIVQEEDYISGHLIWSNSI